MKRQVLGGPLLWSDIVYSDRHLKVCLKYFQIFCFFMGTFSMPHMTSVGVLDNFLKIKFVSKSSSCKHSEKAPLGPQLSPPDTFEEPLESASVLS